MAPLRILLGVHGQLALALETHPFVVLPHALREHFLDLILQEAFLNLFVNFL